MGIDCTLHTLGRLSPTLYYDDAYRNAVAAMKELRQACERHKVSIAVEFVWSGFLFSPLEMKRFLDEIASPWIGFYYDPGNMAIFQFPQHWARILGPHIKRVHLKDWNGDALNGAWPALLTGKVDFPAVMRELRAAGYDGPLVSEVSTKAAPIAHTADAIIKIAAMG
jgi:hexulose-6-phosphate isomerase